MTTMSSVRAELPSGGWADLRPYDTVKRGDRNRILKAMDAVQGEITMTLQSVDMVLALAVTAWSFDFPIPNDDLASLDEIPPDDGDYLEAALQALGYGRLLSKEQFALELKDGQLVEGSPT